MVTVSASDSPGGVFSLSPTAITLSEETASTGSLTVQRTGGTLTQVEIEWEAVYTDGEIHDTAINRILGQDRATLTFPVGVTSVDINLTLQPNSVSISEHIPPTTLTKAGRNPIMSSPYVLLRAGASEWGGLYPAYSVRRRRH